MPFLNQFFEHQGVEVLIAVKDEYMLNREISDRISRFEQKFFTIDTDAGIIETSMSNGEG